MKHSQREIEQMRQELAELQAGRTTLKPWHGKVIFWKQDMMGNFVFEKHVIPPGKITAFKEKMGGTHLMVDVVKSKKRKTLFGRIRTAVNNILHTEPVQEQIPQVVKIKEQPEAIIWQQREYNFCTSSGYTPSSQQIGSVMNQMVNEMFRK